MCEKVEKVWKSGLKVGKVCKKLGNCAKSWESVQKVEKSGLKVENVWESALQADKLIKKELESSVKVEKVNLTLSTSGKLSKRYWKTLFHCSIK